MASSSLCDDCLAVAKWLSSNPNRQAYNYPKDGSAVKRSSEECKLCRSMNWHFWWDHENITSIELNVERDWDDLISAIGITFRYDPKTFGHERLNVWVDEDRESHTRGKFCTVPGLEEDDSPNSTLLIQEWINRCLSQHDICRKSVAGRVISEEEVPIPAERILDVGNNIDDPIRLVNTQGLTGRYCSLSHCWGPAHKRPACVVRENENQYFQGVSINELPKTFQDAVRLSRSLNIRYLWIDSLCIIQDSIEHWCRESARMGAIYEGAFIRIAASGANDSSEGLYGFCLCSRLIEELPETIKLPSKSEVFSTDDVVYLRARPSNGDPDSGPLASRAWAFQESRLSRRTVSFMRPGISWECKHTYLNERNCFPYDFHDTQANWATWEAHVEKYSCGELTYESDRLVAIQGLVKEIEKTRKDLYHLGIWLGDLPRQLLWRISGAEVGMKGISELPSWTWARWPGRKQYLYEDFPKAPENLQIGTRFVSLGQDDATITLEGSLMECTVSQKDVNGEEFAFQPCSPESMIVTHWSTLRRLLWADNNGMKTPVGLVQLDEAGDYGMLHCSIMLVSERRQPDPLRKWEEENKDEPTATDVNVELSHWELIKLHGKSMNYYWILLMQSTGAENNQFRRVGSGLIWPTAWAANRPTKKTFYLV